MLIQRKNQVSERLSQRSTNLDTTLLYNVKMPHLLTVNSNVETTLLRDVKMSHLLNVNLNVTIQPKNITLVNVNL